MKDAYKKIGSTLVEHRPSQENVLTFVVNWATKLFGGAVLVVESAVACVPLIFFKESFQGRQYCFGVVWYNKELTIEQYMQAFLGDSTVLARTPPPYPFDADSMKVFAVYLRGKFGERELWVRVAVGRYE